jgi:hypothetical protein
MLLENKTAVVYGGGGAIGGTAAPSVDLSQRRRSSVAYGTRSVDVSGGTPQPGS